MGAVWQRKHDEGENVNSPGSHAKASLATDGHYVFRMLASCGRELAKEQDDGSRLPRHSVRLIEDGSVGSP